MKQVDVDIRIVTYICLYLLFFMVIFSAHAIYEYASIPGSINGIW